VNNPNHIVIDLETLGLKPGCRIISIGATDLNLNTVFYAKVDPEDFRFSVDTDTVEWWAKQKDELVEETFSGTETIDSVLTRFSEYLSQFGEDFFVWGNAASFDLKILETAYEICNVPVPWSYKQEMCYRTLKNLFPEIKTIKPITPHHALDDAIAEAKTLELYLERIKNGPVK
jgi:DNA polymerase III epsilon subunit-like protein